LREKRLNSWIFISAIGDAALGRASGATSARPSAFGTKLGHCVAFFSTQGGTPMLKFLGTTMGIIFLIGLLVVIGLLALIF
jgi:hypothetical protein